MSSQAVHHLTPEQYLEIERTAEYKSEYLDGQMYAMAGASMAQLRSSSTLASNCEGSCAVDLAGCS